MSIYRTAELSVQGTCSTLPRMATQLPVWHKIEVGKRIVDLRTAKGMSQKALADAMTITPQKLWNYESGSDAPPQRTCLLDLLSHRG